MTLLRVSSELSDGRARLALRGGLDLATVGRAEAAPAERLTFVDHPDEDLGQPETTGG